MGVIGDFPRGEIDHRYISSMSLGSDVGARERLELCVVSLWSMVGHAAALVDVFRLMVESGCEEWAERGEVAVSMYVELRAIYGELVEVERKMT